MAELFSPKWTIQREEIIDFVALENFNFQNAIEIKPVEEFQGSLREAKQRASELFSAEPIKLKYAIPPRVKYFCKLNH